MALVHATRACSFDDIMLSIMGLTSLDRRVRFGLLALAAGQILFLMGWGVLYVVALLFVLTVGLPYPRVLQSLVSRLVAAFVLLMSVVQLAAVAQFLVLPASGFGILSLLVTVLVCALVWFLRQKVQQPTVLLDRRDLGGLVVALFFALPLTALCFWQNDPARLTSFASVQGVDGSNHYTMVAEMARIQHLNYRNTAYYPKGFHIASAFVLHSLHANQQDQGWLENARLYIAMFIAWGALLAYVVWYAALQLRDVLSKRVQPSLAVLALCLGPALTLLYLLTLTQEGFLSYFYVIAAVVMGALYLQDERLDRQWQLVAYLVLTFGVAATWGPLLAPALLLASVLYVWPQVRSFRQLVSKEWRWALVLLVLQLVPIYLHLRYAHLSTEQGINATGGLKAFDYGIFSADFLVVAYALLARDVAEQWRRFTTNFLMPFVGLVGALMCYQYFTVGELRYYAIKTAMLLGVLVLMLGAVVISSTFARSTLTKWQALIIVPILFGLGVVTLSGVTANPFDRARILFGTLGHLSQRPPTLRTYANLGVAGRVRSNTVELRYNADGVLTGNAVVTNWANLMQFTPDNTVASSECGSRLFDLLVSPASAETSDKLLAKTKQCAKAAADRHEPFIVVTDAASASRLRGQLDGVTFAY